MTARPPERWADFDVPNLPSIARGGFLRDVYGFDEAFFGISPREAREMDPQQRLMLELSWEALHDAALAPRDLKDERAGVFFGCMWQDYVYHAAAAPDALAMHSAVGLDTSVIAARVSYRLGLRGPSLTINTGCSSALVSVHLACQSLRSGESRVALAGGVNLMLAPHSAVAMARFGGLSPDGRCKSFDARADGYVRGEGGGVIVLKRLRDAISAKDPIYCVLRSTAVNNDGASQGIAAPCPHSQAELLREAYARAGIAPHRVHYVETHGTGTKLGDSVEATALGNALGQGRPAHRPLRIGSVKTNIGHTEAAAGIAGLIKVALAMRKRMLPRNLHFETPGPDLASLRLRVQTELEPWPCTDEVPTAGVSSFGFGGTNAHVVLQGMPDSPWEILPVSGEGPSQLTDRAQRLDRALCAAEGGDEIQALCQVASRHWSRDAVRTALVVSAGQHGTHTVRAAARRAHAAPSRKPRVAFVFSGAFAPWAGMARSLLASEAIFRDLIEACDDRIRQECGLPLLDALWSGDPRFCERCEHALPMVFAVQVGVAGLLRAWGIEPDEVVGHGIGEIAAAHHSGILDLSDAAQIVCRTARLLGCIDGRGATTPGALGAALAGISPQRGRIRMLSTTNVRWLEGPECDGSYWVEHQRQTARFAEAVPHLARSGNVIALEISPEPILAQHLEHAFADLPWARVLSTMVREADGRRTMLNAVAALYEAGIDPHWEGIARSPFAPNRLPDTARQHLPLTSSAENDRGVGTLTLPISAHDAAALREEAARFALHLTSLAEVRVEDIIYKATRTRTREEHRLTVTASSRLSLAEGLEAYVRGDHFPGLVSTPATHDRLGNSPLVFLFSGHGSQWIGMCRELMVREPAFRAALTAVDAALTTEGVSSVAARLEDVGASPALRADDVQPRLFAIQVSLAALWRSWGIEPSLIVGHSVGEVAAAHVAGCLDLPNAARVIAERARAIVPAIGSGGMAVVELPRSRAMELIEPHRRHVAVAVHQSPRFSVLSGNVEVLGEIMSDLVGKEVFCRWVDVDYASHGPQMEPLSEVLCQRLAGLSCKAPTVSMISTTLGLRIDGAVCDERYWAENLRRPVLFHEAISLALASGARAFVEVSPHPLLTASIREIAGREHADVTCVPSLRRRAPEVASLHQSLGTLYAAGRDVDWTRVLAAGDPSAPLPPYSFQRKEHQKRPPRFSRTIEKEERRETPPSTTTRAVPDRLAWRRKLLNTCDAERLPIIHEWLTSELARVLRTSRGRIEIHDPFSSLGLDSLMGLELRSRIEAELDISISGTLLWNLPTIDGLAKYVLQRLCEASTSSQPREVAEMRLTPG